MRHRILHLMCLKRCSLCACAGLAGFGSINGKGTPWVSFINGTNESLSWLAR